MTRTNNSSIWLGCWTLHGRRSHLIYQRATSRDYWPIVLACVHRGPPVMHVAAMAGVHFIELFSGQGWVLGQVARPWIIVPVQLTHLKPPFPSPPWPEPLTLIQALLASLSLRVCTTAITNLSGLNTIPVAGINLHYTFHKRHIHKSLLPEYIIL